MHNSLKQNLINIYKGIDAYNHMKDYLSQNAKFNTTSLTLFNYFRKTVNKYDLCNYDTKLKNSLYTLFGQCTLTLTKSI